ncbi:hypothetical protein KY359_02315, partial [Candidatus Woesearchaeota archaeon]|nr:hypothetical protein [Candidatus Woesearchaeota archaeon]
MAEDDKKSSDSGDCLRDTHRFQPPPEQPQPPFAAVKMFLIVTSIVILFFMLLHLTGITGYFVFNLTDDSNETGESYPLNDSFMNDSIDITVNDTTDITVNVSLNETSNMTLNDTGNMTVNLTENITANITEVFGDISVVLISPPDSGSTANHVNFTFELISTEGVETCGLHLLYRYLQEDFWLAANKTLL